MSTVCQYVLKFNLNIDKKSLRHRTLLQYFLFLRFTSKNLMLASTKFINAQWYGFSHPLSSPRLSAIRIDMSIEGRNTTNANKQIFENTENVIII